MTDRLLSASHFIRSKEWKKAKQELLCIHLLLPNDMSILSKLGDICKMIHQNDNAKQCYQRCINNDKNNFLYYYKMAILYHDLNQLNDAKIYYEKSLLYLDNNSLSTTTKKTKQDSSYLNNNNNHKNRNKSRNKKWEKYKRNLYFHYGQLLMKIDLILNFDSIKKYFDILLNKFNPKTKPSASLHFNYAKLLYNKYNHQTKYNKRNDLNSLRQQSLSHFEKAIQLKPNIIKYHEEYAIILASMGLNEKAESLFERSSYLRSAHPDDQYRFQYVPYKQQQEPSQSQQQQQQQQKKRKRRVKKQQINNNKLSSSSSSSKKIIKGEQKEESKENSNNYDNDDFNINSFIIDNNYNAAPIESLIYNKSNKNNKINKNICLIIYDIGTLAYLHSFKALKKLKKENIYHMDAHHILDMFGGRDRIEILRKHFELIKSFKSKGIKINIISTKYKSDVITEALKRVDLYKYFKNSLISGSEILSDIKKSHVLDNRKLLYISKMKERKKFMANNKNNKNKLLRGDILFIDNSYIEYSSKVTEICDCIIIQHQYEFLLNRDMALIEEYLGVQHNKTSYYKSCELSNYEYPFNKSLISLSSINYELYISIRNDIAHASFNKQERLKQYNYINNMIIKKISNMHSDRYQDKKHLLKQAFFYFAKKFQTLCEDFHSHQCWSAMNLCLELMEIEANDSELCRMLALCLSNSQLFLDAEYYYLKSLSIKTTITCLNQYGHFLIMLERYDEACDIFEKGLEINPISKKALIGYARSLAFLDENKKAEEYYKKCIEYYNNWDLAYFRYGKHCYLEERYCEAKELLIQSIKLWPYSAWHHYFLSLTYMKLGEIEEFEYHLDECLKLEPDMKEAINKWERHHCRTYNISYFRKKKFLNKGPKRRPTIYKWDLSENNKHECLKEQEWTCFNKQFEIFWFNKIYLNDRKKSDYYTRFVKMKINDIRILLFNNNYEMILRSEISITSLNDLNEIKIKVNQIKDKHEKFKKWLNDKPLSLSIENQNILFSKSIYTKEIFQHILNKNKKNLLNIFGNENEMTANWIWKHRNC